ncbi:adenylate kinase-domain-containing protein [Mycotypha africana]|uniref:adenylate kinase-domain-containing protein n=1 Tax=Mycotypha africana TaxID=64632 RepID=UPI002301D4C0|nr:adenylate kinase-domain-containing protein [Mycotypha africana]KAI8988411.1 adenylate kinase-domain-containing protein [Mycotypha africana]
MLRRCNSLLTSELTMRKAARYYHDCPTNAIQPLRLLLIGCPGSGKGTQSTRLQRNFGVAHLSSGDLLRKNIQEQTVLGRQAEKCVADGKLAPDDLVVSLIDAELRKVGNANWLLDGFPRTLHQAKALDANLNRIMQPLNLVINLQVPEEVILQRIMDRYVHIPSGRVYNLSYNPPQIAGLDDITGEPLSKRPDDTTEVFKVRLDQHHRMAAPLLDHYQDIVVHVEGSTSDEIYPKIEKEIVNRLGVLPAIMVPDASNYSIASIRQQLSFDRQDEATEAEEHRAVAVGAN